MLRNCSKLLNNTKNAAQIYLKKIITPPFSRLLSNGFDNLDDENLSTKYLKWLLSTAEYLKIQKGNSHDQFMGDQTPTFKACCLKLWTL